MESQLTQFKPFFSVLTIIGSSIRLGAETPSLTIFFRTLYNPKGNVLAPQIPFEKGRSNVPVQMELRRIIINEIEDSQVIVLKEAEGDRAFPIVIGFFEATSIDRRVKGLPSQRPLTHDLINNVIEQMGGELRDIVISDLRDHTYYAKLRIMQDGELLEIDCRPSDAVALAVTARVPIYVSEDVLSELEEN